MKPSEGERLAGMARAGVTAREAVTYGGRALNPFSFVGSLLLMGVCIGVLMMLLKVVLG